MKRIVPRRFRKIVLTALTGLIFSGGAASAKDYYLVIGGGPNKEQNQASLEANVQFLQRVLERKSPKDSEVIIYFADGDNPDADLQVLVPRQETEKPVSELLSHLHRRGGNVLTTRNVEYRDNDLKGVSGSTQVQKIEHEFERLSKLLTPEDRLFLYVTAHGSAGPQSNPQNTKIACWGGNISAGQMMRWLDKFPEATPVYFVMAQCYTGGFANVVFEDIEERKTLSNRNRIGFFAQQHDLPAAGCRPDIENDQEFSSYFWGAILGETRNGEDIVQVDLDGDGSVSLEEAFAYTVSHAETIDIPLRASDALLKEMSRIPDYQLSSLRYERVRRSPGSGPANRPAQETDAVGTEESKAPQEEFKTEKNAVVDGLPEDLFSDEDTSTTSPSGLSDQKLVRFAGPIEALLVHANPSQRAIVRSLCEQLDIAMTHDVDALHSLYQQQMRSSFRGGGGMARRGGRSNNGRQELLKAIFSKWPELGTSESWEQANCLKEQDQSKWIQEIRQLPEFSQYEAKQKERQNAMSMAEKNEVKSIKYRRLIFTLECIVLETNLPEVASSEVVERYKTMKRLENAVLGH